MALLRRPPTSSGGGGEPPGDDDAVMVRAIADPRAFAPLYQKYVDAIYRHCYRQLGEREAAEDITGQVFRKALESRASYHGGSFKAWLFRIADNALIDAKRRRQADPLDDELDWLDPAPGPEELAVNAFDREQLRRALEQLPSEWRRVVELRLDGFSCEEVARIIGNSRSADWVRQCHRRAMLKLRQILLGDDGTKGGAR